MINTIKFEVNRHRNKRTIIIVLVCIALVFLIVAKGNFLLKTGKNKDDYFIKLEKDRLNNYTTYVQYGTVGVVILNELPEINVLFAPHKFILSEMCNIRNDAFLKIYADIRGKEKIIYSDFISFSNFILILSIFFPLLSGFTLFRSYRNIKYLQDFKNSLIAIISRFLFLIFFILACFFVSLLSLKIFGVHFTGLEFKNFLHFFFQSVFVCAFFYLTALLISITIFVKKKKMVFLGITLGIIILVSPLVINSLSSKFGTGIPLASEVDYYKSKHVFDFERRGKDQLRKTKPADRYKAMSELARDFLNNEYMKIHRLEADRIKNEQKVFDNINKISAFSPISFYLVASDSIAGLSNEQYFNYIKYCDRKQAELLRFFIDKMYSLIRPESTGKIEPFFKNNENIFKAKSQLPKYHLLNSGINGLYLLLLITLLLFNLKKYFRSKMENVAGGNTALDEIKPEDINFIKARTKAERDELFDFLKYKIKDAVFLDRVSKTDFFNIKIKYLYDLYRSLNKIDEEKFIKYLGIFKINDTEILEKKISEIENADFKRFYAALVLANDKFIVVNDYLAGEDLELRMNFSALIEELNLDEKRGGVYIGFRLYKSISPEELKVEDSNSENFQKYLTININERTNNFARKLIF